MSTLFQIAPSNVRRVVAALMACGLLAGWTPVAAEAGTAKPKAKEKEKCVDSTFCGDGRRNG